MPKQLSKKQVKNIFEREMELRVDNIKKLENSADEDFEFNRRLYDAMQID